MQYKFQKGDVVISKEEGIEDLVESVPGMHAYDKHGFASSANGFCLKRSGWEYQEDWKLKRQAVVVKNVNFLLKYDLDEDPIEEFETMAQVNKRIKELLEDETLQRDSVVVYEIKSKKTVEFETGFKLKAA